MPKTVIMQLGQAKNPTGAMRRSTHAHAAASGRLEQVSMDGETLAGERGRNSRSRACKPSRFVCRIRHRRNFSWPHCQRWKMSVPDRDDFEGRETGRRSDRPTKKV